MAIEVEQPAHGVVAGRLQPRRRPRKNRRRTARDQWRDRADREGLTGIDAAGRRHRAERAIEPAALGQARARQPAFQHVLAVEMRALAIGRRCRMHDGRLARLIEPVQVRHCWIEREEAVEPQCRIGAFERERVVAAQPQPVRVANRGDSGETVERAAQYHDQQSWIAAFGERDTRQIGPSEQNPRGEQQFAAGTLMPREGHSVHRRWNSGVINKSASACGRTLDPRERLLGVGRQQRAK